MSTAATSVPVTSPRLNALRDVILSNGACTDTPEEYEALKTTGE
jgi:hypothetical protein